MLIRVSLGIAAVVACGQFEVVQSGPEPVRFLSEGVSLAGEIAFPPGAGPFPAVVLVHGSGPVTREGNRPLVAPFLTRGIAVLSYDKRGNGESGGLYRGVGPLNSDSMIRLLADDAVAALELLAKHERIDRTKLGLAGGSQAGWIIPNAAARFPVRFAVMLSGPLVSVGEEIHYSLAFENSTLPLELADSVLAAFAGPRGYSPMADIVAMKGEAYWVLGGLDRSIPAVRSAQLADSLIRTLGRTRWRLRLLPSGDHSLFGPDGRSLDVFPPIQAWLDQVLR